MVEVKFNILIRGLIFKENKAKKAVVNNNLSTTKFIPDRGFTNAYLIKIENPVLNGIFYYQNRPLLRSNDNRG